MTIGENGPNTGLGADMTPEATLAKLSYILAKEGLTTEERKKLLVTNLRGELTQPDMKRLTLSSSTVLSEVAASLRIEFKHMEHFTRIHLWQLYQFYP